MRVLGLKKGQKPSSRLNTWNLEIITEQNQFNTISGIKEQSQFNAGIIKKQSTHFWES